MKLEGNDDEEEGVARIAEVPKSPTWSTTGGKGCACIQGKVALQKKNKNKIAPDNQTTWISKRFGNLRKLSS